MLFGPSAHDPRPGQTAASVPPTQTQADTDNEETRQQINMNNQYYVKQQNQVGKLTILKDHQKRSV